MSYKDNPIAPPMWRSPEGKYSVFGTIINNGHRAEDSENAWMNRASFDMYFYRLCEIGMSVFEWKNLPDGVDERMLEYWLFFNGFCLFFYDPDLAKSESTKMNAPDGFAVLPCTLTGKWDMYNYPKDRTAYSMNGDLRVELTEENSVICFNSQLRLSMFDNTLLFAKRLADIDRTIDINVHNQKSPRIIVTDDEQRLTFKNIELGLDGNQYSLMVDKNLDINQIKTLDLTAPFVGNDMRILRNQIWNDALTYYGVENTNSDKKERVVTSEVMLNAGAVEVQRFTRLMPRKQFCEEVNRLWGSGGLDILPNGDIDVDFKAGVYVRSNETDSSLERTAGMEEGGMYE